MNRLYNKYNKQNAIFLSFIIAVSLAFIRGCSAMRYNTETDSLESVKHRKKMPAYHDFDEILIPTRYKLDKKSTFVFQTPGLAAGVLVFKGKIKLTKDINFFNKNMVRDNWNLITSFKSPRTMLIYNKQNRWCVINISVKESKMEIWVAPTIGNIAKKDGPPEQFDEMQETEPVPPLENFDSGLFKD